MSPSIIPSDYDEVLDAREFEWDDVAMLPNSESDWQFFRGGFSAPAISHIRESFRRQAMMPCDRRYPGAPMLFAPHS